MVGGIVEFLKVTLYEVMLTIPIRGLYPNLEEFYSTRVMGYICNALYT